MGFVSEKVNQDEFTRFFVRISILIVLSFFGFIFWFWRTSYVQRDRLLDLVHELDVPVIDKRGLGSFFLSCTGGTLVWVFLIIFASYLLVLLGPVVRQYRTVSMYNTLVMAFEQNYVSK